MSITYRCDKCSSEIKHEYDAYEVAVACVDAPEEDVESHVCFDCKARLVEWLKKPWTEAERSEVKAAVDLETTKSGLFGVDAPWSLWDAKLVSCRRAFSMYYPVLHATTGEETKKDDYAQSVRKVVLGEDK